MQDDAVFVAIDALMQNVMAWMAKTMLNIQRVMLQIPLDLM